MRWLVVIAYLAACERPNLSREREEYRAQVLLQELNAAGRVSWSHGGPPTPRDRYQAASKGLIIKARSEKPVGFDDGVIAMMIPLCTCAPVDHVSKVVNLPFAAVFPPELLAEARSAHCGGVTVDRAGRRLRVVSSAVRDAIGEDVRGLFRFPTDYYDGDSGDQEMCVQLDLDIPVPDPKNLIDLGPPAH